MIFAISVEYQWTPERRYYVGDLHVHNCMGIIKTANGKRGGLVGVVGGLRRWALEHMTKIRINAHSPDITRRSPDLILMIRGSDNGDHGDWPPLEIWHVVPGAHAAVAKIYKGIHWKGSWSSTDPLIVLWIIYDLTRSMPHHVPRQRNFFVPTTNYWSLPIVSATTAFTLGNWARIPPITMNLLEGKKGVYTIRSFSAINTIHNYYLIARRVKKQR